MDNIILVIIGLVFVVGFISGKVSSLEKGGFSLPGSEKRRKALLERNKQNLLGNNISIDESKVVVDIKTENFSKGFDNNLAKKTTEKDVKLSSSISKLSELKNKKKRKR